MADNDSALTAALRAVAAADLRRGASVAVQNRLLEEVRGLRRSRRRGVIKASIIGAALCLSVALPLWQLATLPRNGADSSLPSSPQSEMSTPFFPLEYSAIPMSGGRLVRMEVPWAAMAAFGIEDADLKTEAAVVVAEVMVGDDGFARAVRFVRPAMSGLQKERRR